MHFSKAHPRENAQPVAAWAAEPYSRKSFTSKTVEKSALNPHHFITNMPSLIYSTEGILGFIVLKGYLIE
jgi:hypothetical protein